MEIILNCGDKVNVPEGCKAEIKDGVITIESEIKEIKDGDILTSNTLDCVIVYRKRGRRVYPDAAYYHCYASRERLLIANDDSDSFCGSFKSFHLATEEGKQFLFNKMKEQGLRWNAEEKRVEKIRWRAKKSQSYFFIDNEINSTEEEESGDAIDDILWRKFNYFRTQEQAEEAAKLVKATLKKFHEENS